MPGLGGRDSFDVNVRPVPVHWLRGKIWKIRVYDVFQISLESRYVLFQMIDVSRAEHKLIISRMRELTLLG